MVLLGSSAGLTTVILPSTGFVFAGNCDRGLVADFQQRGFRLRNVSAGDDLRSVHHGEQRSAGRGHLSGIEGTVGDHAIDRAADFGITELRGRAQILSLG